MTLLGWRSWVLTLVALCLTASAAPVRADFSLGFANGLTGWSTAGDSGTVTASNGLATILESASAAETDLYINFMVPTTALSLQFRLTSVTPDSTVAINQLNGYSPDFFGASLLNPKLGTSLVPTVDATTDSFYTRDVVQGVTQGQAAAGVTVSSPPGVVGLISLDLSSVRGSSVELLFRLAGGTDPTSTSAVTISNVNVFTQASATVPEPRSLLLITVGIILIFGYRQF